MWSSSLFGDTFERLLVKVSGIRFTKAAAGKSSKVLQNSFNDMGCFQQTNINVKAYFQPKNLW